MSRKHKFHSKSAIYFVSFATVKWISFFIRNSYFELIIESLNYCQESRKLEIYAYCIMPNHMHLIFDSPVEKPMEMLREFKRYTARMIKKTILESTKESRREWLLKLLSKENDIAFQFWQHNNRPIKLFTHKVIKQKLDYIHNNPVVSGFVLQPQHWRYSSANNYQGELGELEIHILNVNSSGIGRVIR